MLGVVDSSAWLGRLSPGSPLCLAEAVGLSHNWFCLVIVLSPLLLPLCFFLELVRIVGEVKVRYDTHFPEFQHCKCQARKRKKEKTNKERNCTSCGSVKGAEYQQIITSKETHDIGTLFVPRIGGKKNWSGVFDRLGNE